MSLTIECISSCCCCSRRAKKPDLPDSTACVTVNMRKRTAPLLLNSISFEPSNAISDVGSLSITFCASAQGCYENEAMQHRPDYVIRGFTVTSYRYRPSFSQRKRNSFETGEKHNSKIGSQVIAIYFPHIRPYLYSFSQALFWAFLTLLTWTASTLG